TSMPKNSAPVMTRDTDDLSGANPCIGSVHSVRSFPVGDQCVSRGARASMAHSDPSRSGLLGRCRIGMDEGSSTRMFVGAPNDRMSSPDGANSWSGSPKLDRVAYCAETTTAPLGRTATSVGAPPTHRTALAYLPSGSNTDQRPCVWSRMAVLSPK